MIKRIGIIGGGAWGTALACAVAGAGAGADHDILLWARETEVVQAIQADHRNPLFLPGVTLPAAVRATGDLTEAAAADALLLVVPAQHFRHLARRLGPHLPSGVPLVICAKGIEQESGALMSEIVAAELPAARVAVLSGPTFAIEVAQGLPTAVTLAAQDSALGAKLVQALGRPTFRPYLSDDPIGAEIGGAVKNVLAIACGIVQGRELGDNARAALITRGLAEILRLGRAKGAHAETLMGLSGLGDLVLTCTGQKSRNFSLGIALGQGQSLDAATAGRRSVAEGATTAPAVVGLAERLGVEMPIAASVNAILHHSASIDATIEALLSRPFKSETPV